MLSAGFVFSLPVPPPPLRNALLSTVSIALLLATQGCAKSAASADGSSGSGGAATGGAASGGQAAGGASSGGAALTGGTGGRSVDSGGNRSGGSSAVTNGGNNVTGGASGGRSDSGATGGAAGSASSVGGAGAGGGVDAAPDSATSGGYALPPPNQSVNQFFIPGCQAGVATSPGGGNCTPGQNACEATKQGARVNFLCPRFMLFSDEMTEGASDDGLDGFNYGVVGHDLDSGGIDGNYSNSCCQCYQLVFSLPENVAQVGGSGAAAIPIPPPMVVQSFNTAAGGGKNFDVFMGAGGFGAFNACDPNASMKSPSGKYLYTQFPSEGEPGSGGVNAATQIPACQSNGLVTTASLSSSTCQSNVASACSKFASSSDLMTGESVRSCTKSNDPNSYYHMNWKIYAKRVECPTHLTQVTGCKLSPQGLPAVNPAIQKPDQAAADSSFKSGYTITTMQDCCMPTCAWQNNVAGQNLSVVGKYDSFYSCDQNGVPLTEPGSP